MMYGVCTVTFMDQIPTMPIVVLYILAVIYYFNTIDIVSDPECVTNSTGDNKNKYPAPDYVVSIHSHSLPLNCTPLTTILFSFQGFSPSCKTSCFP